MKVKKKRYSKIVLTFKTLSFFLFLLLLYTLVHTLSTEILRLKNLLFVLRFLKAILVSFLILLFGFASSLLGGGELFTKVILISILTSIFFSDVSLASPLAFLQGNISLLISGIILLLLLLVFLYGIGFIKTGEYEYVLWSFLLVLVTIVLGILFLPFQLNIPNFKVGNLSAVISSPLFLFLMALYFFLVVGEQLSYFSTIVVPISRRVERISSKVMQMERLGKIERGGGTSREKRVEAEKKSLVEQLSSLPMATLKDAYKGYSFAGQSTSLFITSKLKSFIESQREEKPDLLESLAGRASLPSLKKYFLLSLFSFFIEISLAFPIGLFALMAPTIMQGFYGDVFIIGQYEFSVFIIFTMSLFFFLLLEMVERRLK